MKFVSLGVSLFHSLTDFYAVFNIFKTLATVGNFCNTIITISKTNNISDDMEKNIGSNGKQNKNVQL